MQTLIVAAFLLAAPAHAGRVPDARNVLVASCMADKYHVSRALLLAIRYHENPSRLADYKACGCRTPERVARALRKAGKPVSRWAPGGIWGQYRVCAQTVARRFAQHEWPLHPTRAQVTHLGEHYAEGSQEWGPDVWNLYQQFKRNGRA